MCTSSVFAVITMPAARVSPANYSTRKNGKHPAFQETRNSSSSECPSLQDVEEEDNNVTKDVCTPYQKVLKKLRSDEKWQKEIALGRRIGFYKLKEELGTGNFSQVKTAIHSLTKERVAVKILDKSKLDKKTQRMLSREISSMESLHHPNVIRLYEVLETFSRIYLVMEYAGGGELFHRISQNGQFTEKAAKPIFAQITAAVDHMHAHSIVHRDLKAENVFFSGPETVKVGDFGFSTRIRDCHEPLKTFCGSPPYAAPELFRDDSYAGPAVDVWALGVLLYFMLTATMPFKAQTVAGLKKQILDGEFTIPDFLSTECHFLIVGILKQDPKLRTSLDQIKRSNWLKGQTLPGPLPKDRLQVSEICSTQISEKNDSKSSSQSEDKDKNGNVDCISSSVANTTASSTPSKSPTTTNREDNTNTPLSTIEFGTRQKLHDLGITMDMLIEEAESKGSRSNVLGSYRIVLHKMLTQSGLTMEDTISMPENVQFLKDGDSPKKLKVIKNKKSKMCIIL
ncbi:serine/threonine-protein kinase NIM1-like [Uloborus diversus]|uniref:serine/threonine-protein kinase NIM1-like n=1 Tax=Uloborus diversus TaxID=327109 RepID=UPI0024090D84|nr:serine/threonine-protein kinase NIM1-like [Uloborus diversus]